MSFFYKLEVAAKSEKALLKKPEIKNHMQGVLNNLCPKSHQ